MFHFRFRWYKCGLIILTCFGFVVTLSYLITSTSTSTTIYNPVRTTAKRSSISSVPPPIAPPSPISSAQLAISLPLPMAHIHAHSYTQLHSFNETFMTFPWDELETAAAKNLKSERLQFTKLFIDELTYFIEMEPLVPINENCQPPPLPSSAEVNCSLYPNAFSGIKRNDSVKIGAILQLGFDVDVLEIYLHELYGVVDLFFIIESTHAHFESIRKPLVWERVQRQERFSKFPVVHFIIDDAEPMVQLKDKKWSMEIMQERRRWEKFVDWNGQTRFFGDNDVIGFGDADEIPSRAKLNMFKYCQLKGESVDFGIWFPFGRIDQAFRTDYPVKGHPYTLGDPTFYTVASAKALVAKKPNEYPNRKRGKSGNFMLGGMHMTHYGYLPFQLVKYCTATESNMQTLKDVQKLSSYLRVGDVLEMEAAFAATPKHFERRIIKVDLSKSEMKEICVLPWFYDCNRNRYPVWEGGHDTRLDTLIDNKTIEV
ncbi:hypothetical protein HA402_002598 [Bradysia odoriphaga]|nr:hypothetical protein HA402_002598 [Bradysia odoriphaga]